MSNTFRVYNEDGVCMVTATSLDMARKLGAQSSTTAYILESDKTGRFVHAYSFCPPPKPRPSGAWPEDITQTVAWKHCADRVRKEVQVMSVTTLVRQQLSQPHEPVLEDICSSIAKGTYSYNIDFWASSLRAGPDASSDEAERCIVDELEGLARRELRSAFEQLRSDISAAIALIDRME